MSEQMRKNIVATFEGGPRYKPVDAIPNLTRGEHSSEYISEAMAPTGRCNISKQTKLCIAGSLMVVLALAIVLVVVLTTDNRYSSAEDDETKKIVAVNLTKLAGTWSTVFTNGARATFAIKPDGEISFYGGKTVLEPSDDQVNFPSSKGWMKGDKLWRYAAWSYYRVAQDGTLEVQHFRTDDTPNPNNFHNLDNYCCSGIGLRQVAVNLTKLAGTWSTVFTNGARATFAIKSDGEISLYGGKTVLEPSDDQVNFPSSEGWMKGDKLRRYAAWSYYRVAQDGTLEVQHFRTFGTPNPNNFQNLDNYCCSGIGHRQVGCNANDPVIPVCPAYATGHLEGGLSGQISFSPKTEASCRNACKDKHPTSIGVTLTLDESRCYCEFAPIYLNGCDKKYKTCAFPTAHSVAVNLTKLAGTWSTVFTNGVRATFAIKPDGEISFYGGKTVLEPSDDQVNFPSSEGWMKGDKLWGDSKCSYYRVAQDGTLEVHHFHSDKTSNTKNFHDLDSYCCSGIGHRQVDCNGNDPVIPVCPAYATGDLEGGTEVQISFSPKTEASCRNACKDKHPTSIGVTLTPDESRCYCEFAPIYFNGCDKKYKTCAFPTVHSELLHKDSEYNYFKVPMAVGLNLTSDLVLRTCKQHGMIPQCLSLSHADSNCVLSPTGSSSTVERERERGFPTTVGEMSKIICNTYSARKCPSMSNMFWYMNNWNKGSACGLVKGSYCTSGWLRSSIDEQYFAACLQERT